MTEVTAGAETPAAEGAQPSATVENAEATTAQQSDAESTGNASPPDAAGAESGDDAAAAPRKKPGVHNRIDELTRQKHDAIRDRDYWRGKFDELARTDLNSLEYDDQLVAKVRLAERKERAEGAEAEAARRTAEHFDAMQEGARERWPDYDIVTGNQSLPISEGMADVIRDSEIGADLFYHLGKNPAEAARIFRLPVHRQAAELGKLEARLAQAPTTPQPAPAPVRPVNAVVSGGNNDPGKMSMAEYIAWREGK